MVEASVISDLFSNFGPPAKIKLVSVGLTTFSESLTDQLRSLNLEHVSSTGLMQSEISRHTPLGHTVEKASRLGKPVDEQSLLALWRRWFWARKPDAGFAVTGFPATLLQAKVFDEWLDARDEALNGVIAAPHTVSAVVDHYRTLGVLVIEDQPAPAFR